VTLLLNYGANVNVAGGRHDTALAAAAYDGHEDILGLLIARGADVNAASSTSQYGTALAAASWQGKTAVVPLLLGCGANPNIVSGDHGTALAAASFNGHIDIVSILLGYPGLDINAIGGQYGTALSAALSAPIDTSISPCTKLLLDHGADVNLVDCMYGSPLGKAVHGGNEEHVSLLLGCGADAFHVGSEYETDTGEYPTALDAARAGKASEDVVTLLSRAIDDVNPFKNSNTTPWPPFPMPFRSPLRSTQVPSSVSACDDLVTIVTPGWNCNLTLAQAGLPYKLIDEELLRRTLVSLVGVHKEAAERCQVSSNHYVVHVVSHRL